jgi:hypothetical protein
LAWPSRSSFFDPIRIIGALIVAVGFVLFAIIVLGTCEAAARL